MAPLRGNLGANVAVVAGNCRAETEAVQGSLVWAVVGILAPEGNAAQSLEPGNSGSMQVAVEDSVVGKLAAGFAAAFAVAAGFAVDSRTAVGFVVDSNSVPIVAADLGSIVGAVVGSESVAEFVVVGFDSDSADFG